jgi:hypothetical protein
VEGTEYFLAGMLPQAEPTSARKAAR